MASIPPPTAPLTTTATDSVGCHTRANFALVGGRRDLKNLTKNFTPNTRTRLYIGMRYLLEVRTIAGIITLGPFDTLEEAYKYRANTRGLICPIWQPKADLNTLIEAPHAREVFAELEKVTEKLHKKTPKITRARTK